MLREGKARQGGREGTACPPVLGKEEGCGRKILAVFFFPLCFPRRRRIEKWGDYYGWEERWTAAKMPIPPDCLDRTNAERGSRSVGRPVGRRRDPIDRRGCRCSGLIAHFKFQRSGGRRTNQPQRSRSKCYGRHTDLLRYIFHASILAGCTCWPPHKYDALPFSFQSCVFMNAERASR